MSDTMRLAVVAAEMVPLAKVGGLGDVVGALSDVLGGRGHEVAVFLPAYRDLSFPPGARRENAVPELAVPLGSGTEPGGLVRLELPGHRATVFLVTHRGPERFFDRPGIYTDPATGEGYPDNARRFLFFSRAVLEGLKALDRRVDVLHVNDAQTAFVPAFLRHQYASDPFFTRTGTLLSIHNLGYQGLEPPEVLADAGFGPEVFWPTSAFEFFGSVNFMKVGISFADLLNTVSPRYAREIRSEHEYGLGLEGVLAERSDDLRGIVNGIDYAVWNPENDPHLAARYSAQDLRGKAACRRALAERADWPADPTETGGDWPIVGMITRLVDQKGFDLIRAAADSLMKLDVRLFVLGTGQKEYHTLLEELARRHPNRVAVRLAFDDALAHQIEAGSDMFLMPSRYEPCGLNQLMSLRYGTVPVVRATGGLADTVQDFDPGTREGTGFVFQEYEADAMLAALKRALATYRQPHLWHRLVQNCMAQDFSWEASATQYEDAYREVRKRVEARRFGAWAMAMARR